MKLKEIAHSRAGDKGDIANVSLIPYDESLYEHLKAYVTAEAVKAYFAEVCHGQVKRYSVDGIRALNFVMEKALGGGVLRSLAIDKQGKTYSAALLEMEVPPPGAPIP